MRIVAMILLIVSATNCASFARNRFRDLADTIVFTYGSSVGASVRAGPLVLGLEVNTSEQSAGLQGGYFGLFERIPPESRWPYPYFPGGTNGACIVPVLPHYSQHLKARDKTLQCILEKRNKAHKSFEFPAYQYGAFGFSFGIFIAAIRLEINILEILDLGAGFVGLDPLDDDDPSRQHGLFAEKSFKELCTEENRPGTDSKFRIDPNTIQKSQGAGKR